ncbi:MAG TPA: DinB family protein [Gemmatimonadaceae bacterium]|nr:DinB family protein [Gemmatimonadaceae bacterium]
MGDARGAALHPRIEELLEHLEETRAALIDAVRHVAPDRRDARAGEGRWTVGEVLDHVSRVEAGYARLLGKRVSDARARGLSRETETSSILGSVASGPLTDRTRRLEAPEIVVPRQGATVDEGLAALASSRAAVRAALLDANGLALGTLTQDHPFLGTMNMYQWGVFVGLHDLRHAAQIREVAHPSAGS